jgi:low affinity Fe/Cu permease
MIEKLFSTWATRFASWTGTSLAFVLALASVVLWAAFGPATGFSDDWMLVINTGTTIVTFLMVFLIQSSQNRDTLALQTKLDELIRVTREADDGLMDIEALSAEEIAVLHDRYSAIAKRARALGVAFPHPLEAAPHGETA